ncbi:MAG: hypothetical protein IKY26_08100 [Erysipelotrichaceae bacterium]|nr:hypothetical protein [Erysipelotrichaceae bacterium]
MILQLLQVLFVSLFGTNNRPVNDLRKKPTREDHLKTINCIIERYWYIFVALFLIAVFIVFFWACFTFVGASGVESGNYYNHLTDVI